MHALTLTWLLLSAAPKVSSAVVYPDRAEVTRVEGVACNGRSSVAVFESLPPAADPASFRAQAEGATVKGLVAEERTREAAYSPAREELRARREALQREQAALQDAQERSKALEKLGEGLTEVAVQRVSRELAESPASPRVWSAAFDAALAARLRAVAEQAERRGRQRELQRQLALLSQREGYLEAAAARLERRVEVRLDCPAGARAQVSLRYVVGGAGWEPAYEARADEANRQVELTTYATVRQATGEDWRGARLVLSTAQPRADATVPELQPLLVYTQEQQAQRKVLVRRDEYHQHAQSGAASQGETEGRLSAASQGLSVQLSVPEPAEVPGDGTAVRLRVARTRLPATFSWRTVPKLYPTVFRVARLFNSAPFPLLPGPVDVYRATGLLGRQRMERVARGAPLELTFGVEEGLRVERQVVEEVARQEGLFGSRRRFRYAYRFVLRNFRPQAEEVELAEHVPVSELDDVVVELDSPRTTAGYSLEEADGIATWKVRLAAGETRTVDLTFHVDVPSSYEHSGL